MTCLNNIILCLVFSTKQFIIILAQLKLINIILDFSLGQEKLSDVAFS